MSLQNVPQQKSFVDSIKEMSPLIEKVIGGIVLLLVIIFGINWAINSFAPAPDVNGDVWIPEYSPKKGPSDAKVTVVLFYDLQCPACADNNAKFENIVEEYKDRVQFVYRNLPLDSIHPLARLAGEGSQAAAKQDINKFVEYKTEVYASQRNLSPDRIEEIAKEVGLDFDQWNKDRNSRDIEEEVEADREFIDEQTLPESTFNGLTKASGTPTTVLLVDEEPQNWWSGSQDEEAQKAQIEAYLE